MPVGGRRTWPWARRADVDLASWRRVGRTCRFLYHSTGPLTYYGGSMPVGGPKALPVGGRGTWPWTRNENVNLASWWAAMPVGGGGWAQNRQVRLGPKCRFLYYSGGPLTMEGLCQLAAPGYASWWTQRQLAAPGHSRGQKMKMSTLPVGGTQRQLAAAGPWGRDASWRPRAMPVGGTQRQLAGRKLCQLVGGPKISKSDWAQSAGFCTIRQAHLLCEIDKKVRARPFPIVKIYILIGIVQRNCFSANIPSTEVGGYV